MYPLLAQKYHQLPAPGVADGDQLKLGLDLKGGVHLVMRVNTDDALQPDDDLDERAAARLASHRRRHRGRASTSSAPTKFRVDGVPPDRDSQFRHVRRRNRGDHLRPQSPRRRVLRVHDEADRRTRPARADGRPGAADDRSPRQRARRCRAEHRPAAEGRRDPRPAARRDRRRARERHHGIASDPRVQARRERTELVERRSAEGSTTGSSPPTWRFCRASPTAGSADASTRLLRRPEARARDGAGSAQRASRGSTRTTSRRSTSS